MITNRKLSRQDAKTQRIAKSIFARLCDFAPLRETVLSGIALILILSSLAQPSVFPQTTSLDSTTAQTQPSVSRYLDQTAGLTVDESVAYALAHNAELEAMRKEVDAAKAMVKQARLRTNPMLGVEGKRRVHKPDAPNEACSNLFQGPYGLRVEAIHKGFHQEHTIGTRHLCHDCAFLGCN